MSDDETRQQFEVALEDEAEFRIAAEEFDIRVEEIERDEEGIAPIVVFAAFGAASVIGGAWAYFQERRRGGQVIDLREGQDLTRRDKGVVYGLVVIIAEDGKVTVDVKEPKNFFGQVFKDVLEAIQGIAEKTIDAAAAAAKAAAGDKAEVSTEPAAA